ncbi:MAG: hypothetical protein K1X72_12030 [Pyrinomonadaceae bacterium]|nr:hypothetical protein [Pyrinomonadaceae bacterium]
MKILSFGVLLFALSFCNIADKFIGQKTGTNSSNTNSTKTTESNSTSSPTSSSDGVAEKYALTPEQSNILNGGKEMKWDEQGMSWTLPTGWKKMSSSPNSLQWALGTEAFLIVSISPMSADFPTDVSLKANYDGAVTRQKNGELEKLRYLELDGIKGIEFIETMLQGKDSPRRQQWIAFRKYAGQVQMVNVMLSTKGASFDKHRDEFAAIMSSTKMAQ